MTHEASGKLLELAEHPRDLCECGDYRSHHPGNGPCTFNGPGFDMCHGGSDCVAFRLAGAHLTTGANDDR